MYVLETLLGLLKISIFYLQMDRFHGRCEGRKLQSSKVGCIDHFEVFEILTHLAILHRFLYEKWVVDPTLGIVIF